VTGFNLSAWAVRERTLTLFFILVVLITGVFAFLRLGRAEDPQFTVKVMTVALYWPGATAKEMVDQVGDPLEKRLQELEYYDRAETAAYPGTILMKVFFKDYIPPARLPEELYQARKKLGDQAGTLPKGVTGPIVNDEFSDVYFALYAFKAKGVPHRQLVLEAEDLRQRLLRVNGVEKVNILGEQAQRIYVEISYQRLATLGVNAGDLIQALKLQNDVTPSGFVDTTGPRVYLRLDGAFDDVATVRNIPVNANGTAGTPAVFVNAINGADGLIIDEHDNLWIAANQADEIVVVDPSGRTIAKLGDFGGLDHEGAPIGLLFPASLVFSGRFVYVTNLAIDLRLFDVAGQQTNGTGDSPWTAEVKVHTISRIPAFIPPVPGLSKR